MSKDSYSEESLFRKISIFARVAGMKVIHCALVLYYTLKKPETPAWAKGIIVAALGAFILPIDLIPDIVPVVGYADDLGAMGIALGTVAMYIDEDVKSKARAKLKDIFGDVGDEKS